MNESLVPCPCLDCHCPPNSFAWHSANSKTKGHDSRQRQTIVRDCPLSKAHGQFVPMKTAEDAGSPGQQRAEASLSPVPLPPHPLPCLGHVSSVLGYGGSLPANVKYSAIFGLLTAFVQIGWLRERNKLIRTEGSSAASEQESTVQMEVEREEGCLLSKTGIPQPSTAREEEVHPCRRQCRQGQEPELGKHPAGRCILQGPRGKSEPLVVLVPSKGKMFGSTVRGYWCRLNQMRRALGSVKF